MEAATRDDLVAWARAFGLRRLLKDAPAVIQKEWEAEFVKEAEAFRVDDVVCLGGITPNRGCQIGFIVEPPRMT